MIGAEESQSRAEIKKWPARQANDTATAGFGDNVLLQLQNLAGYNQRAKSASSLDHLATTKSIQVAQESRERKIARTTAQISLLEQMGEVAEAIAVRVRLRAPFKALVDISVTVPTHFASTAAAVMPAGCHGVMAPPLGSELSVAGVSLPEVGWSDAGQVGAQTCRAPGQMSSSPPSSMGSAKVHKPQATRLPTG